MRRVLVAGGLAVAIGCGKTPTPTLRSTPTPSPDPSPAPSASTSAPMVPPPAVITPACCTMDRAEGIFGSEKTVYTKYVGDYLRRKDGERLLYPQDLISDTKELFQHAKSAGQSITQTRTVRVIGETPKLVGVTIEDHGHTGTKPFVHASCKTVRIRDAKIATLADAFGDAAENVRVSAERAFQANAAHVSYRFLATSFAIEGEHGDRVRFCAPRRDEEGDGAMTLDVVVPAP